MVSTVGLIAPNGNVGAAALKHLIVAHKEGKIRLVVLHRPNSPPKLQGLSAVQPPIDIRAIDLEGDAPAILEAVKDLNIVLSTVAVTALPSQLALVEALAKSPNIVTFIPSAFGSLTFTTEDAQLPQIRGLFGFFAAAENKAKELGVGVTTVDSGIFAEYFFGHDFLGTSVKANKVRANKGQLANGVAITSLDYLGAALATLVSTPDATTIANKKFSAIQIQPTGQELIDVLTRINGSAPAVTEYTEAMHKEFLNSSEQLSPIIAGYSTTWQDNSWNERSVIDVQGYEVKTLEQIVRDFA